MTFVDLLFVIVGAVLGFILAPFVVPHLTERATTGAVLTHFLALIVGIGTWIASIMLRIKLQQIKFKHQRK